MANDALSHKLCVPLPANAMNHKERFLNQMLYQPVDRTPLYDFLYWSETIPVWHAQGLPRDYKATTAWQYFGLDAGLGGGELPGWYAPVRNNLLPRFESQVIEQTDETETVRQPDGVIVQRGRGKTMSIPMHVGHTLVDRDSWERHYLPKLDPDDRRRVPDDLDAFAAASRDPNRDHPIIAGGGSLFGWVRDWMGIENIALVPYDDPAWFEEMVTACADVTVKCLQHLLDAGVQVDVIAMWEDMCYSGGPLLGPAHFEQFLVPQYKRVTELGRKLGAKVLWVDCDGKIDELVPLWLEGGINCMFPIEVGTWKADPLKFRDEYGRDLLLMGGFDKRILADTPEAITAEVERLAPLVEEGGFIGFCDHRVPPDVPYENYLHYLERARAVWANHHPSLRPMCTLDDPTPV